MNCTLVLALLLAPLTSLHATPASPPNIILVMPDDVGVGDYAWATPAAQRGRTSKCPVTRAAGSVTGTQPACAAVAATAPGQRRPAGRTGPWPGSTRITQAAGVDAAKGSILRSRSQPTDAGTDPYWTNANWQDASILPPPSDWGGGLPGGKLPPTLQTDPATGKPLQWPLRYTICHWAALLPGLSPGSYDLCCRTIDGNGIAQPLPRTLPCTGFNTLHVVNLIVKA